MAFFKITHTIPRNSRECYFLFNSLPQNYAIEERQKKRRRHDTERWCCVVGLGWVRARAGAADGAPLAGQPSPHARTTQRALCGPERAPPRARIAARRASAQGTEQTLRPCPCAHAPKAIFNAADGRWKVRSAARARTGPAVDLDHSIHGARQHTNEPRPPASVLSAS